MEVDAPQHTRYSPFLAYFDTSPASFPFRAPTVSQIEHRRALLSDQLIFDILLSSGGIRVPDLIYPPRNEDGLQKLLDAIANSQYDNLKKDCLVYFLLKWQQDGREERFRSNRCIPPQFAALADAYWYLDSGVQIPKAVSLLSDARLNRDYASKILQAISLSPDSPALIRQYVRTAQPSLTEPDDLDLYTLALAENSLLDAWQFQRTFPDTHEIRPRLWKKLVEWCIAPQPKPIPLKTLLHLPLSSYEESQLHTYALTPSHDIPISSVCVLQDLICVRLIQTGRYSDAIKMNHKFLSSPTKNNKEAQERNRMIQQVYSALSSIERSLVEVEIDGVVEKREERPKPRKSVPGGAVAEPADMSMSWEEIRASDATPVATPAREGIPERSGAPRFGGPIPAPTTPTTNANVQVPVIPTVPITSAVPTTHAPRKSLPPLSSSVASTGRHRHSLSGAAQRIVLGASAGISSPASGLRFASPSQATPKASTFTSASKHANAFYQPPVREKEKEKVVEEWRIEAEPPVPAGVAQTQEKEDVEMLEREQEEEQGQGNKDGNETENEGLGYSVFGTSSAVGAGSPKRGRASSPENKLAQSVPGGFMSDEEEEQEVEPPKPKRRTKTTTTTTTRTKRQPQPSQPRISIPGSFASEETEGEDGDHVEPLPSVSPTNAKRGAGGGVKKGRSSASLSVNSDLDEGVKTRRSSRLSHAGSLPVIGDDSASTAPPPAKRKSTRSGAGKKRK